MRSGPGSDGPLGFGDDEDDDRPLPSRREPEVHAEAPRDASGLRRRGPGPGGWVLGIAVVIIFALILVNTLRTSGPGSRGPVPGAVAPAFAAPLASSELASTNDVNVATRSDDGDAGKVPACSISRPDVVTSCALWRTKPVVLAFFATRGARCVRELDQLDDVARRHPGVGVVAVAIRGDLKTVRALGRDRGWGFPVAYDRDGVLANLYAVAVCPQLVFVAAGGHVVSTSVGSLAAGGLEGRFRSLER